MVKCTKRGMSLQEFATLVSYRDSLKSIIQVRQSRSREARGLSTVNKLVSNSARTESEAI